MQNDPNVTAYPLCWPAGWTRKKTRVTAQFYKNKKDWREGHLVRTGSRSLTIAEGVQRVVAELRRMSVSSDDITISTNVKLRLDGFPASNSGEPADPGAAVYWKDRRFKESRCMAIDMYDRVADNLAAIGATLDAMRAIERHGGATILDRAFRGFKALPEPEQWWQILGLPTGDVTEQQIVDAHRTLAIIHHPDKGGSDWQMARINEARNRGLEEIRSTAVA